LSSYDQKYYFGVQVGALYLHSYNGEGFYTMPEVGALCDLVLPSDSSPPYIGWFLAPSTIRTDVGTPDAPDGTNQHGQPQNNATDVTFSAGRPRAKPGDMVWRGRDDNFVIMHRGGILQLGATPVCQRIYMPIGNLISDFSGRYQHQNPGGSISWGLQEGPSIVHSPTQYMHTFRVFADDQFADVRVAVGKVYAPTQEPDGDKGETVALEQLGIGTREEDPIIMEVSVAKNGFVGESGAVASPAVRNTNVFRFFFDRVGGTFLRAQGNVLISAKKKMTIKVEEDLTIEAKKGLKMSAAGDVNLGGKTVSIQGDVIRLGQGNTPMARQGDIIQVIFPFTPMMAAPTPLPVQGSILGGTATILG
jgi:hypothetical protein